MPIDYFKEMTDEQAVAELARIGIAYPKPREPREPSR